MRWLVALALCWSVGAWGATGSAAVDTWYVRPAGACANNGDGLAYGCAASEGASGAFVAFSNIIWTTTTGVDDDDTLYVCGTHATQLAVGANGGASARINIDFRCPNDAGAINGAGSLTNPVLAQVRNNINILYPAITHPTNSATNTHMLLDRVKNITVTGPTLTGVAGNAARGIVIRSGNPTSNNYNSNNVRIEDGAFSNLEGDASILLLNFARADSDDPDSNSGVPYDIFIDGNTFSNVYSAIRSLEQDRTTWYQQLNNLIPYGVQITDNTITDSTWAIWQWGWKAVEGFSSKITGNVLRNIGDATVPLINAIQVERARGGQICGNTVTGITTQGTGDGHAIILDYVRDDSDADYLSDSVTVCRNALSGAKSHTLASGIKVWRATNNTVTSNVVWDSNVGLSNSNSNSTGNVFQHNSAVAINHAYNIDQSSAEITMRNNAGIGGLKGIRVNSATDPAETYSRIQGDSDITLHATSSADNPEFVNADGTTAADFRLRASSPACGAGTYIAGVRDYDDLPMGYPADIGAFRCPGGDSPAPSFDLGGLFTWLIGLAGLLGLGHMMRDRYVSV